MEMLCFVYSQLIDIWVVFVWIHVFISRIGILGSYGNTAFHFLRHFLAVFQSNFTFLLEMYEGLVSLHPLQHLLLSVLFIIAILVDVLSFF